MDKKFKAYEWNTWDINTKISYLHKHYYKLCMWKVNRFRGLDTHTKKECIWDAMWTVAKKTEEEFESIESVAGLVSTIAYYNCRNALSKITTIKRGSLYTHVSMDNARELTECDTNLLNVELALFIEQLRPQLTKTEYRYIQLILQDTHIPTNTEAGLILGVTEGAIRKIKKSLKNKIRS